MHVVCLERWTYKANYDYWSSNRTKRNNVKMRSLICVIGTRIKLWYIEYMYIIIVLKVLLIKQKPQQQQKTSIVSSPTFSLYIPYDWQTLRQIIRRFLSARSVCLFTLLKISLKTEIKNDKFYNTIHSFWSWSVESQIPIRWSLLLGWFPTVRYHETWYKTNTHSRLTDTSWVESL